MRIARLYGFAFARLKQPAHVGGNLDGVAPQNRQRVLARRRIGNGWTGSDVDRVVARHVGNEQRHHICGMARRRQPAALERGQMAPHAIHFGNVGAALEQRLIHHLLVGERQAWCGRSQQRRASTGNQAQHEIVGGKTRNPLPDASRRLNAGSVGHGMRGLDDLDTFAANGVTVACNHQPVERTIDVVLDRARHGGRRLAGAGREPHHGEPGESRL